MQEFEVLENQPQTDEVLHFSIVRALAAAVVQLFVSNEALLSQEQPAFQLLLQVLQGEIGHRD